jgi:hypothetical protein
MIISQDPDQLVDIFLQIAELIYNITGDEFGHIALYDVCSSGTALKKKSFLASNIV